VEKHVMERLEIGSRKLNIQREHHAKMFSLYNKRQIIMDLTKAEDIKKR